MMIEKSYLITQVHPAMIKMTQNMPPITIPTNAPSDKSKTRSFAINF